MWLLPLRDLIRDFLPAPVRIQGRSFFRNLALDIADRMTGRAEPDLPPRHLNISGGGSFRAIGQNNLAMCQTLGGLSKHDRVLDLGCGIGRTALPLSAFLESPGSYLGIDALEFAIRWCQRHIKSEKAEFHFVHTDVFNKMYHPRGAILAENATLPTGPRSHTFVIATSLFTHLVPAGAERYVAECSRVLAPGGTLLATWFLLDEHTLPSIRSGGSSLSFPFQFKDHAQMSDLVPEGAVAYKREYVETLFSNYNLALESVRYGHWSGAGASADWGQDVTVARRLA